MGTTLRWRESEIFKNLIEEMGEAEAKRRRYIVPSRDNQSGDKGES